MLTLIRRAGLTQDDLAKLVDVDPGWINSIARGKKRPGAKLAAKLCAVLTAEIRKLEPDFGPLSIQQLDDSIGMDDRTQGQETQ